MTELDLGTAVRVYREARGLSRRALSMSAGLSESVVGKVEAGGEPSLRVFAAIVTELGMKPTEIALLVALEARRIPVDSPGQIAIVSPMTAAPAHLVEQPSSERQQRKPRAKRNPVV